MSSDQSDRRTCQKCGEEMRARDLGMHDRVVHTSDALFLFHDDPDAGGSK